MLIADFINSLNNVLIHQSLFVVHVFAAWFALGVMSQLTSPAKAS